MMIETSAPPEVHEPARRRAMWTFARVSFALTVMAGVLSGCDGSTATTGVAEVHSVSVDPPSVSVLEQQSTSFRAIPRDASGNEITGRQVTWSSSSPSTAAVNSGGVVMGMAPGTASITATVEGRQGQASVTVTPIPVASVTVAPTSDSVAVGGTLQLTATPRDAGGNALTGRTVTWSSSNTSRASVSESGLVTGVGAGTVTVTAISDLRAGTATLTVIVPPPPPSSGTLGVGFGDDQFSLIPNGTFQMGSTNGGEDEAPVHSVTLTRSFHMQRTEVTQGQWREIMGTNPSHFSSCGDTCPVERLSWDDIQPFLTALNARYPGRNYRLPTEAEWEYAARAGTTGDYGGTGILNDMGWYLGNSGMRSHPVARKQPNAWGLFDMHGNVGEWVQDRYSGTYYSVSPGVDPTGPATPIPGSPRVYRGGSWNGGANFARSAFRAGGCHFCGGNWGRGFRLARTL